MKKKWKLRYLHGKNVKVKNIVLQISLYQLLLTALVLCLLYLFGEINAPLPRDELKNSLSASEHLIKRNSCSPN